jgi:hypothetical protein
MQRNLCLRVLHNSIIIFKILLLMKMTTHVDEVRYNAACFMM